MKLVSASLLIAFALKMASVNDEIADKNQDINLAHPEVLTREKIIEILVERRLPLNEICNLEKHALVELFYKFVVPLPQRLHQLRRSKRRVPRASETNNIKNSVLLVKNRGIKRSTGDSSVPNTVTKFPKKEKDKPLELETFDWSAVDQASETDSLTRHTSLECTVVNLNRKSRNSQSTGKIVKLNRKSLGLQLDRSTAQRTLEELHQETSSTAKKEKPKSVDTTVAASNSNSVEKDFEQTETKFKKVAISYDELKQTSETKKFKKVAITWP